MTNAEIMKVFRKFLILENRIPTTSDFVNQGITRNTLRHHFGNFSNLITICHDKFEKEFNAVIGPINFKSESEKKEYVGRVQAESLKYSRFVITAYSSGSKVNVPFYKSLKNYCRKNKALLLILPITGQYKPVIRLDGGIQIYWSVDKCIQKENFLLEDLRLNKNLILSTIKLSTKQVNPLTGLNRLGQKNGSFIYGSPKQFLETVATSNTKLPSVLLTTGVLNDVDYNNNTSKPNRADILATSDHTIGALVTEVVNSKLFFVRQLQAGSHGEICDLDKKYTAKNTVTKSKVSAIVFGDTHGNAIDKTYFKTMLDEIRVLKPQHIFIHDFFNGTSVNHHIKDNFLKRTLLADTGGNSLQKEVVQGATQLKKLLRINQDFKLLIVKSNHDEFLVRYLEQGRYLKDFTNQHYALYLAENYLKTGGESDPLKFAIETCGVLTQAELRRIVWLKRDQDFVLHGVECGAHGDLGANGTRGGVDSLERAYCNLICGHGHAPAIRRGYWRVGINCIMDQGYNRGPSGWCYADVLLQENSSRQLLIKIDGLWKVPKKGKTTNV